MAELLVNPGAVGFLLAALALLILAGTAIRRAAGSPDRLVLGFAAILSAVVFGLYSLSPVAAGSAVQPLAGLELLRAATWAGFLVYVLRGGIWSGRRANWRLVMPIAVLAIALVWIGVVHSSALALPVTLVPAALLTLVFSLALVLVEQIVRNARGQAMTHVMLLGVGLALLFAFDLLIFARRLFSEAYAPVLWQARGYVTLLALPLVAVWTWHPPATSMGLFVSRSVVFHSATAVIVLIALSLLALASLFSDAGAGEWAGILRVVVPMLGIGLVLLLLLSEAQRARLRRFIVRNFFASKYDLGAEWQRLTANLSLDEAELPAGKRAVRSLAQILDAPAGQAWLLHEDGSYRCIAAWNVPPVAAALAAEDALAVQVADSERVFETSGEQFGGNGVIVPLHGDGGVAGFVYLRRDENAPGLDFQDRELLQRAARQVCSFVLHEQASEQLVENRQFEAFNRFTAFVMHDLKNLAAQQELLVSNARKYRDEPEFIDDAIDTIEHSARRMQQLLAVLAQPSQPAGGMPLALHERLADVLGAANERTPEVVLESASEATVIADGETLDSVLLHLIRNAQDATTDGSPVLLRLETDAAAAVISVEDRGSGMDEAFVRQRLFRPFDSTKGSAGMGIGAYQVREFVRAHGGSVEVDSQPGRGTRFTLRLPLAVAGDTGTD